MPKGRFIVVDGTDGSGKTSAVEYLVERISENHTVFFTEESTKGTIGAFIKRAFKRGKITDAWTLASLLKPYGRYSFFGASAFRCRQCNDLQVVTYWDK